MARRPRPRKSRGRSRVGERFTAVVGPVAHGGHCVVRLDAPDNRVVFTRHALPGETVVLQITEGTDGDRFWRGDAVEVLSPSPDRVVAPCPVAGPGLCGGCDFQHASLPAQRSLKTVVVREQLVRLGGLDPADPLIDGLVVTRVPVGEADPDDGLRWRTRVRYATTDDGRRGMRKHHSHEVVPVDDCLIAHPDAGEPSSAVVSERVETTHGTREYAVAGDGFWQVHPGAPAGARGGRLGPAATRSRGSGRSTSTPGSGCSPASCSTPSGPTWSSPSRATAPRAATPAANLGRLGPGAAR